MHDWFWVRRRTLRCAHRKKYDPLVFSYSFVRVFCFRYYYYYFCCFFCWLGILAFWRFSFSSHHLALAFDSITFKSIRPLNVNILFGAYICSDQLFFCCCCLRRNSLIVFSRAFHRWVLVHLISKAENDTNGFNEFWNVTNLKRTGATNR